MAVALMPLLPGIAFRHLMARKRQSVVSLLGIVVGVAFFLAISSLMQGSQRDFMGRLVDNSPHINITADYRDPARQPLEILYPQGAVDIRNVRPQTEPRGLRGYRQILAYLRAMPGLRASAVLTGQALLNFAGRDTHITLNGMVPSEIRDISTIEDHMTEGTLDDLAANRNGIILGAELMRRTSLGLGDNITLTASGGQARTFKIVGVFRTGRADYDQTQAFTDIKRVQALTGRANRADTIIVRLDDPEQARDAAARIERRIRYKSVSWQEANEDIMKTFVIRNVIMYAVVSAVLLVAAFGIYNVISTIVMEKHRDIAILKSMGFVSRDIRAIFVAQGLMLGLAGIAAGIPLGCGLMYALMQVTFHPPGMDEIRMPVDWSLPQFLGAGGFAMASALLAAWLPARKGAALLPVDVLRGGQ